MDFTLRRDEPVIFTCVVAKYQVACSTYSIIRPGARVSITRHAKVHLCPMRYSCTSKVGFPPAKRSGSMKLFKRQLVRFGALHICNTPSLLLWQTILWCDMIQNNSKFREPKRNRQVLGLFFAFGRMTSLAMQDYE